MKQKVISYFFAATSLFGGGAKAATQTAAAAEKPAKLSLAINIPEVEVAKFEMPLEMARDSIPGILDGTLEETEKQYIKIIAGKCFTKFNIEALDIHYSTSLGTGMMGGKLVVGEKLFDKLLHQHGEDATQAVIVHEIAHIFIDEYREKFGHDLRPKLDLKAGQDIKNVLLNAMQWMGMEDAEIKNYVADGIINPEKTEEIKEIWENYYFQIIEHFCDQFASDYINPDAVKNYLQTLEEIAWDELKEMATSAPFLKFSGDNVKLDSAAYHQFCEESKMDIRFNGRIALLAKTNEYFSHEEDSQISKIEFFHKLHQSLKSEQMSGSHGIPERRIKNLRSDHEIKETSPQEWCKKVIAKGAIKESYRE